ncbi:MAG: histidine kinase N-terminal domain-containing protein [Tuberibacillus sp.]
MGQISTTGEIKNELAAFLDDNQEEIMALWEREIYIEETDIFKERVRENGLSMFYLVRNNLIAPISDETIKQLAYKVATERVEANINIGDFVYNMNVGRSIIVKYIILSGSPIEVLQPIIDDVNYQFNRFCYHAVKRYTELKDKELQEKILFIDETHKDRLSLLGQMSSSFVHEFRNPLTSVIGFVKLLKSGDHNQMYLDIITHELNELNFRITKFLHTSKTGGTVAVKKEVLIKILVNELLDFFYPSIIDSDVDIKADIDPSLKVIAHDEELQQVFQNLLMNAIDAVKENKRPRRITISCREEGNHIKLDFSNNGPAIPLEKIKTIFEPFYTTKELGTGIGLYVCKKIVEKYNGTLSCESNEHATTFIIRLPKSILP